MKQDLNGCFQGVECERGHVVVFARLAKVRAKLVFFDVNRKHRGFAFTLAKIHGNGVHDGRVEKSKEHGLGQLAERSRHEFHAQLGDADLRMVPQCAEKAAADGHEDKGNQILHPPQRLFAAQVEGALGAVGVGTAARRQNALALVVFKVTKAQQTTRRQQTVAKAMAAFVAADGRSLKEMQHKERGHGTKQRPPGQRLVPERRALFQTKQHTTNLSTKGRRHAGGRACGDEITLGAIVAECGFVDFNANAGGLALGKTGADDGATVDHGAFFSDGHGCAHAEEDANDLDAHGLKREPVSPLHAVKRALDFRDTTSGGGWGEKDGENRRKQNHRGVDDSESSPRAKQAPNVVAGADAVVRAVAHHTIQRFKLGALEVLDDVVDEESNDGCGCANQENKHPTPKIVGASKSLDFVNLLFAGPKKAVAEQLVFAAVVVKRLVDVVRVTQGSRFGRLLGVNPVHVAVVVIELQRWRFRIVVRWRRCILRSACRRALAGPARARVRVVITTDERLIQGKVLGVRHGLLT
eukprot:m.483440 g.483440  ORF g.483440 m.483440 type:complete len:525 (+) comp22938_c0_seq1:1248-2822(+)